MIPSHPVLTGEQHHSIHRWKSKPQGPYRDAERAQDNLLIEEEFYKRDRNAHEPTPNNLAAATL